MGTNISDWHGGVVLSSRKVSEFDQWYHAGSRGWGFATIPRFFMDFRISHPLIVSTASVLQLEEFLPSSPMTYHFLDAATFFIQHFLWSVDLGNTDHGTHPNVKFL
jgi:hypothetical protein